MTEKLERGRARATSAGTATSPRRAGSPSWWRWSLFGVVVLLALGRGRGVLPRRPVGVVTADRDPRGARQPGFGASTPQHRERAARWQSFARWTEDFPRLVRRPAGDARAVEADPRLRRRVRHRRADDRLRPHPGPGAGRAPPAAATGAPTRSPAGSRSRPSTARASAPGSPRRSRRRARRAAAGEASAAAAAGASRAAAAAAPGSARPSDPRFAAHRLALLARDVGFACQRHRAASACRGSTLRRLSPHGRRTAPRVRTCPYRRRLNLSFAGLPSTRPLAFALTVNWWRPNGIRTTFTGDAHFWKRPLSTLQLKVASAAFDVNL